jgi:predicted nucleotidyltransferase
MERQALHERYTAALDALIAQVKPDRSILAAILCGSLSHDTVWAKSDIDLAFVTIDDKQITEGDLAIYADGVNVHAIMVPRAHFRALVEGVRHSSFINSFLGKGRLLYTHDPTIADLFARLRQTGDRDRQLELLRSGCGALPPIDKAHKWFVTRGDLDYTALWILYAATPLARIEVISHGQLADREVIPQALKLNPDFFRLIYTEMLNARKSRKGVQAALDAIDAYVADRTQMLFGLIIDHLREVGDARSNRDIEAHFRRNFDVEGVTSACEYLSDRGLIGKASVPVHLTKRSNVNELAFVYLEEAPDEF